LQKVLDKPWGGVECKKFFNGQEGVMFYRDRVKRLKLICVPNILFFMMIGYLYCSVFDCFARSTCSSGNLPPTLKSWDQIKNNIGISNIGYVTHIDMESTKDYILMDIDGTNLGNYISCSSSDGAKRYKRFGYIDVTHKLTGEFCKKWKLGIKRNWMLSVPDKIDKSQFKVFCIEKGSFDRELFLASGVNKGSSVGWIDYYFCRDETQKRDMRRDDSNYAFRTYDCYVHSGCHVNSYTVHKTCTETEQRCHTEQVSHYPGGDCTTDEEVCEDVEHSYDCSYTEHEDIKEYDTGYVTATGYGIDICSMPIIKNFELLEIYDANLMYDHN